MKNRGLTIFLIIILAILALAILGGMVFLLTGRGHFGFFNFGSSSVSNELVYDKEYDSIFANITIDSDAGDIYIKHSNTEKATVKIYGETEQLEVDDKENLSIKYVAKKCIGFCFNVEKTKIEIALPENFDGKLNIENKYGNTSIADFLNATADVNLHYGDISIDGIRNGKIVNKCGDIEIGTINDAIVENNFGDIEIKKILSSLDIEADCGDIEIKDLTLEKNSNIKNSMGDVSIGRTNDILIDAKTSLGEVDVRNNDYKSEITLKIDNSCGDITVKN